MAPPGLYPTNAVCLSLSIEFVNRSVVFFSYNKSINSIFSHNFSTKRISFRVIGQLRGLSSSKVAPSVMRDLSIQCQHLDVIRLREEASRATADAFWSKFSPLGQRRYHRAGNMGEWSVETDNIRCAVASGIRHCWTSASESVEGHFSKRTQIRSSI